MKKLIKLQNDLFIPEDFAENHKYFADEKGEKKYTGITTILGTLAKPMLIPWAAKMVVECIKEKAPFREIAHDQGEQEQEIEAFYEVSPALLEEAQKAHTKKKEKAGEHGTDMHAEVEQYIKNCIENSYGKPFASTAMGRIKPFEEWAIANVKQFLFSERPVHSISLFLAGTIDFGCMMKDGKRRIGDLKTGSGIYYEAILQCEAYQLLAEEEGDEKYNGSVIVRMGKDNTFQIQERERGEIDEDAFFGLYKAYRGSATFTKPNN